MYDLTVPEGERVSLNVREATGKGIFLEGLSEMEVTTILKLMQRAMGGSNISLLIVLKHLYYKERTVGDGGGLIHVVCLP